MPRGLLSLKGIERIFIFMLSFYSVLSVVVLVLSRFISHPWNFSPVMPLFLQAGKGPRTRIWPLFLALFLSDVVLGFGPSLLFGYLAYGIAASWMRRKGSHWVPMTLAASVLFFILSNFGVWLTTHLYSHDFAGLIRCFAAAIPFFGHTVLGNLFYSFILFELVDRIRVLRTRFKSVV